jgi:hypothetical protein
MGTVTEPRRVIADIDPATVQQLIKAGLTPAEMEDAARTNTRFCSFVADLYGVDTMTVRALAHRWGITRRSAIASTAEAVAA